MKKYSAATPLACALAVVVATTFGSAAGDAAPWQQAQWIAPSAGAGANNPPPLFRKEFVAAAKPTSARLRIVGLGDYDVRINGHRLAETGMNQPWS